MIMSRVQSSVKTAPAVLLDLNRASGNFWLDQGLAYLYEQLGPGKKDVQAVLQFLLDELLVYTGNDGTYYDPVKQKDVTYPKRNWRYPANLFYKISGEAPKIRHPQTNELVPTAPYEYNLNLTFSSRPDVCDLCGQKEPLTDAKMWNFPFIVTPDKFSNFYSMNKRGVRLCPTCAVSGAAAYRLMLWVSQGKEALHFFMFHGEMKELIRLQKEVIMPLTVTDEKSTNIKLSFHGPYLYETLLAFIFNIFSHIDTSDRLSSSGQELLRTLLGADQNAVIKPITIYAVSGQPGQSFNMRSVVEYTELHSFYRLYQSWLHYLKTILPDESKPMHVLEQIFRQFQKRLHNQTVTLWRDAIAREILFFGDPLPAVHSFIYDVKAKDSEKFPLIRGTTDILIHYSKEVLHMDQDLLKVMRGFAYEFGKKAHDENEMGLLYQLRNTKNVEQFLKTLNDTQFRLNLTVPSKLLEIGDGDRIAGSPWERVKTLLSILAMNQFLREERYGTNGQESSREGGAL